MRRLIPIIIIAAMTGACSYDETVETCLVRVTLEYPEGSVDPYEGARVELKDAVSASIFVDSTDQSGVARFTVPAAIYEASSSSTLTTYDYRYFFNGVKSMIIISPDSANSVTLPLTMSKKRIVH